MRGLKFWKGMRLELRNVWRAKHGDDPYGMLLKDRPWPEVVWRTYRARAEYADQRDGR